MFIFKAKELIPVINEARKKQCSILLVKDQGVYFLSEKSDRNPDGSCKNIVFAQGCNPDVDAFNDWWNKASDELGGDDFAEHFDSQNDLFTIIVQHQYDLTVKATTKFLKLGYLAPKKRLN